ncbi:MAG: hypothetical protein AAGG99_04655 [Pseudomonadota bacterium]
MSTSAAPATNPADLSREDFERLLQNGRRERALALRSAFSSLFASAKGERQDGAVGANAQPAA